MGQITTLWPQGQIAETLPSDVHDKRQLLNCTG